MDTENAGGAHHIKPAQADAAVQQSYVVMLAAAEDEHYAPIDELERLARGPSMSVDELLALIDELPPQSTGP